MGERSWHPVPPFVLASTTTWAGAETADGFPDRRLPFEVKFTQFPS